MNTEPEKVPSFKAFDYRIRTNKNAERKMLADAFRCLSSFEHIENYRYIGFGSITFADFVLFHKVLNISDMISIEAKADYKSRFNFNKPYRCIRMEYGESNIVLPKLVACQA
jgi:Putative O-methyltransferase